VEITDTNIKTVVKESELKEHSAKMEAMKVRGNKFGIDPEEDEGQPA
jgi:hypothetical protein